MTITHGSLFTGVGGFDLGAHAAGVETLWHCEINKQCRSVLEHAWPDIPNYTDVCTVNGAEVAPVDMISFGSPCQDLSIAGKRAGFADGTRSNLFFEAVRIIQEMREATDGAYPRFAVWENVRGALSSNGGRDFLAAIQALAALGAVDIEWRLVNTCNFGPPQRRVRILLVADFRGHGGREILTIPEGVCWNPSEGITPWKEAATTPRESTTSSEGHETFNKVIRSGKRLEDDSLPAEVWATQQVAPTLNCMDNTGESRATVLALRMRGGKPGGGKGPLIKENMSQCLATGNDQVLFTPAVRRLTPRECERLQGWPDDHTRWASDGKEISDSARYKMTGNGISSPVSYWLCSQLIQLF